MPPLDRCLRFAVLALSAMLLASPLTDSFAQGQDIFDLFINEQQSRLAITVKPSRKAPSANQGMLDRENRKVASIFDLFVSDRVPQRAPPRKVLKTSLTGLARTANGIAAPPVRSKREARPTPKLAMAVKPKSVVSVPNRPAPSPRQKPETAAAVPAPKPLPEQKTPKFGCDQARSIIAKYAFENVEARSCAGDFYSFAAMRSGKPFLIKISALNGELIEVKRARNSEQSVLPEDAPVAGQSANP